MENYRTVIVGGGFSGLLAAYRVASRDPGREVLILEASERLGGRLLFSDFHGSTISLGGSVIRPTDKRVFALCEELGLKYGKFKSNLKSEDARWVNQFLQGVVRERIVTHPPGSTESVYEYLCRNFEPTVVDRFITNSIYRDFIDGNMIQFVKNYPPDDLVQPEGGGTMYYVKGGYRSLLDRLINAVYTKGVRVLLNCTVFSASEGGVLKTSRRDFQATEVIWATAVGGYNALPPSLREELSHIIGIPFIRVYGYSEIPIPDFPERVTPGIIGKVFPLSKTVFQIAYVEGDWAVRLAVMLAGKDTEDQIHLMKELLSQTLRRVIPLKDIEYKYWSSGIHQNMENKEGIRRGGVYTVIGEAVSTNQGWVEGCIESVDKM
jgi:glycine/D-amino acid oxidase-like deaminating enzyme